MQELVLVKQSAIFSPDGMFIKLQLVEETGRRRSITMFQNVVGKLIPNWATLTDNQLKENLLDLDMIQVPQCQLTRF